MEKFNDDSAILLAQAGPLNGKRWTLEAEMLMGREDNCDIVISDRQVSRYHAKLTPKSDGFYIEDLESKNGTHCNGIKIEGTAPLHDGDVVLIALAQQFIFLSSDATLPLDAQQLSSQSSDPNLDKPHENQNTKLKLDRQSRRVCIMISESENSIVERELTPPLSLAQFRLLEQLYTNQGKVVSRFDLIRAIWGESQALNVSVQALDALVRRLRDRIAAIDPDHTYIVTVRGHGIRLENPIIE